MKRRFAKLGAFATFLTAALLSPSVALADCQIADPGCYIDDFAHQRIYQLALAIWQINRAGLVLARWIEDLHIWLINSVIADAFTTLLRPVEYVFYLVLIVAWLLFVISFMVQSLIDLHWVDLRRAVRPVLLAICVFTFGGSLLKATEYARFAGNTLLQQAAVAAIEQVKVPAVPTQNTGDMADASSSIYKVATSCKTPPRPQAATLLNDYDARYLWANAEDIHCADASSLPAEFAQTYFPQGQDISSHDSNSRIDALARATQGVIRQSTGTLMTAGAIVEQLVEMVFAVALALVWLGILLSLAFAVFVPTEELFSSQIKALLAVIRASWIASFLLGLGLALLQIVAKSGNGLLVFLCSLAIIAVAIWQGKQALAIVNVALASVGAATIQAPRAVGAAAGGWARTTTAFTHGATSYAVAPFGTRSQIKTKAIEDTGDQSASEQSARISAFSMAEPGDNEFSAYQFQPETHSSFAPTWYERTTFDRRPMAEDQRPMADDELPTTNGRWPTTDQLSRKARRGADRPHEDGVNPGATNSPTSNDESTTNKAGKLRVRLDMEQQSTASSAVEPTYAAATPQPYMRLQPAETAARRPIGSKRTHIEIASGELESGSDVEPQSTTDSTVESKHAPASVERQSQAQPANASTKAGTATTDEHAETVADGIENHTGVERKRNTKQQATDDTYLEPVPGTHQMMSEERERIESPEQRPSSPDRLVDTGDEQRTEPSIQFSALHQNSGKRPPLQHSQAAMSEQQTVVEDLSPQAHPQATNDQRRTTDEQQPIRSDDKENQSPLKRIHDTKFSEPKIVSVSQQSITIENRYAPNDKQVTTIERPAHSTEAAQISPAVAVANTPVPAVIGEVADRATKRQAKETGRRGTRNPEAQSEEQESRAKDQGSRNTHYESRTTQRASRNTTANEQLTTDSSAADTKRAIRATVELVLPEVVDTLPATLGQTPKTVESIPFAHQPWKRSKRGTS